MEASEHASDIDPALIRQSLRQILADKRFASAPKLSAFLSYVVEQTLAGNASRIKAYTVAVDALDKSPSFDAQGDPIIRVLAVRLRSTLQSYNEMFPDRSPIISMKPGTYVPTFECVDTKFENEESTV